MGVGGWCGGGRAVGLVVAVGWGKREGLTGGLVGDDLEIRAWVLSQKIAHEWQKNLAEVADT